MLKIDNFLQYRSTNEYNTCSWEYARVKLCYCFCYIFEINPSNGILNFKSFFPSLLTVLFLVSSNQENEAKYQTDRKKWLEEKMGLINQVKEAENHRNREMRKFVEDREHHVKQQAEIVSDCLSSVLWCL